MKKYIIIIAILAAGSSIASAAIWRVNNTIGVARDYDNIRAAVTAAANGDTIHIEGSITAYKETVDIGKKLYIFGPGFNLPDNPQTQHIKLSAKVTNFNFEAGSAGSVLAGIEQTENANIISIADSDIKILNCKLFNVVINNIVKPLQNIDVRKSWFDGGNIRTSGTEPVINLNINNNFFNGIGVSNPGANLVIRLHEDTKALISNNTFYGTFVVTSLNTTTSVANNVFHRTAGTCNVNVHDSQRLVRNLFNVANPTWGMMTHGQNFNVYDGGAIATWFSSTGGSTTVDKFFTAANNSPLIKYATSGQQLGMFGGLAPYELSGLANIPAVYEIIMPNEVSADGFDVTVRVRAH